MAAKPIIHNAILAATCSTNGVNNMQARNGSTAQVAAYEMPTCLPHSRHVAGLAGPSHSFRIIDIAGFAQRGQVRLRNVSSSSVRNRSNLAL